MTAQPEFDLKHHVLVPLPYFHMLVQSYYGNPTSKPARKPQSPATEAVEVSPEFRDMVLAQIMPEGMTPRGFAARKAEHHDREHPISNDSDMRDHGSSNDSPSSSDDHP